MGTFGANVAEVREIACGFPAAGHRKKGKVAEVRVVVAGDRKFFLQGAGTQPLQTYVDRRQAEVAEWVDLRPVCEI